MSRRKSQSKSQSKRQRRKSPSQSKRQSKRQRRNQEEETDIPTTTTTPTTSTDIDQQIRQSLSTFKAHLQAPRTQSTSSRLHEFSKSIEELHMHLSSMDPAEFGAAYKLRSQGVIGLLKQVVNNILSRDGPKEQEEEEEEETYADPEGPMVL